MCGLFGYMRFQGGVANDLSNLHIARDMLTHRGPDQAGEWSDDLVYMGHRRLSILDLSEAGRQPMTSSDNNIVITVNGEIYNFKTLREELERLGAVFTSGSDSEVVLHGYHYWGMGELLEKIDGMYAITLYDKQAGLLYLARDRAGIKPIYYGSFDTEFSWASELNPLVYIHSKKNLTLDNTALYDFLTYRYIPAPKTAYKNIYKLPPAHVLCLNIKTKDIRLSRYWQVPITEINRNDSEAAHNLRALIEESVAEQMVADVPVGFFLSGGIDSSIVVAQAAETSDDLHTFTIGFGVKAHDETDYAMCVAEHFKTQHSTKIITPQLDIPFTQWMNDLFNEPFADSSALPTWYVAAFARKNVTVALSGDGGDELFGGYGRYEQMEVLYRKLKWLRYVPNFFLDGKMGKWKNLTDYAQVMRESEPVLGLLSAAFLGKISHEAKVHWRKKLDIPADYDYLWFFKQHWKPELGFRKALQYLDFHCYMPEDILVKVDRATMAHHLEARVPFLSRKLIEFAFSLSESFIYKNGQLKGGLKYAFENKLPKKILNRNKQGFSLPWKKWQNELVEAHHTLPEAILKQFIADIEHDVVDNQKRNAVTK